MGNVDEISSLNQREKLIGFFYVLILFVLTSVICSFVLFYTDTGLLTASGKEEALEQMARIRNFEKKQASWMDKINSVDERISKIDPSLNASYEKREINFILGEIRKEYVQNKWDERYRIFEHVAQFYELRMFDKERLWTTQKNIEKFSTDLERCRNSLEKKKIDLMK
ncbi:MAG TPA: type VI secretion system transmembrane protein TssO [Paludibacteraceae bacterium]|nr:type VI secretion system transmembrane protein TssO [Paludibacteraceae bacterium]HPH63066.1 type VI secretion system transmembrane protein TssO [Paludibacteraceae bacterium]HQF49989.1 type VI secretion system transmembrane protein TssO [Paludibacteraceae bacterium]HQJ89552.1 type VI secretion system transmembrane protein TssO [Paludibacteraceae bacterium]